VRGSTLSTSNLVGVVSTLGASLATLSEAQGRLSGGRGCSVAPEERPGGGRAAQAALGVVAEYDLLSGCKLGGGEAAGAVVAMAYTADASALITLSTARACGGHDLHGVQGLVDGTLSASAPAWPGHK